MNLVEKFISPLVESQFPEFYKEQGPIFVLFVEEYYKWLESNDSSFSTYTGSDIPGNATYHARRLFEYGDVDQTVDTFLIHLKEKYFRGVDIETNISTKRLIKATKDIFSSKGSERSLDLFFRMVYGTRVEVYRPGDDLLKPSDGKWVLPRYLELTKSSRTLNYPGKMVTGSISGATAFVEYIITRNINGKIIDIAYISSLSGNFIEGEYILDTPIIANAPKMVGSLSGGNITTGGELFSVGDIVTITSARGVEGKARVAGVSDVTGVVRFNIIDGGWGYSTTANTFISEKTLGINNVTNSNTLTSGFFRYESIAQNVHNFSLTNVTGEIASDVVFNNGNTSTASESVSVAYVQDLSLSANVATVKLSQISGNVFSNNIVYIKNKSIVVTNTNITFDIGTSVIQRTGSSNNVAGIVSEVSNTTILTLDTGSIGSNGIHVGTYLLQSTTGARGYVNVIPRENLFTFTNVNIVAVSVVSGTFSNTDAINIYDSNTLATTLGSVTPTNAQDGYRYVLRDTNIVSNTRWSSGNTILASSLPTTNNTIILSSDVGGTIVSNTDFTAVANLIYSNSSIVGLQNITNIFYGNGRTKIYGLLSNTYANSLVVYTGYGANYEIGLIEDFETVRLSPDLISANNDGPLDNTAIFSNMLISGADSTYNYISDIAIISGGSGYTNNEVVVLSGGNTASGYEAGNVVITTDSSGSITGFSISSNVGQYIVTTPSISIVVSNTDNTPTGGTGANLCPAFPLGFIKQPVGDLTYPLIELLRFETKTIGSIASLTGVNPGEDYNINPPTVVYEPYVAAYNKRDIIMDVGSITGAGYVVGETVEQTISTPGVEVISNTLIGGYNSVVSASVSSAGSGFTVRPTVTFDNTGTGGYGATGNTTAKLVSVSIGSNSGIGYNVGDILSVNGGTAIITSQINVTSISTILNQDETDVTSFIGGVGYSISDEITLTDGTTVTVDSVDGFGDVTEFTITTSSTSGITTNNPTLTQTSVSPSGGSNFRITLSDSNQEVYGINLTNAGVYTSIPGTLTDNDATGGVGAGILLDIDFGLNSISITNGGYQYLSAPAVLIGGSGGSGTAQTATLNTRSVFDYSELVYSNNGITNTATGVVYSSTLASGEVTTILTSNTGTWQNSVNVQVLTVSSDPNYADEEDITQGGVSGNVVTSNSTTIIVKDITGGSFTTGSISNGSVSATVTLAASSTIYQITGVTSGANAFITDTGAYTSSLAARGVVESVVSLDSGTFNSLQLKRRSLFTDFNSGGTLVGKTSGTESTVLGVTSDNASLPVGDNANIVANVITSTGSITSIEIVDSGLGYENNEQLTLTSADGSREATAQANILYQGIGSGYYSTTNGFLSSNKYIHDGEYYQNFSYEVQTGIPFDKYRDVLKQLLHVAGKKIYGRFISNPTANMQLTISSTRTIT